MARKIATRLEDIGDERDQAVFMATVKLWFNGDFQAALDHYNKSAAEHEEAMLRKTEKQSTSKQEGENDSRRMHLKYPGMPLERDLRPVMGKTGPGIPKNRGIRRRDKKTA